jgi:hypothetical protein
MLKIDQCACLLFTLAAGACFAQEIAAPAVKNWAVPQYWTAPETNGRRQPAPARPDAASQAASTVLTFVATTPCRIMDTRASQGFTGVFGPPALTAYVWRTIPIPSQTKCNIPSAPAYSLNFTVVPSGPVSFLSAWPDNQGYQSTSVLNDPQGTVLANAAIVAGGADGGILVVAGNNTDLLVDINGYFVNTTITSGLTLPFSGNTAASTTALQIVSYGSGTSTDPTQAPAAIAGLALGSNLVGTYAGNVGVLGQGANLLNGGSSGTGGIGLLGEGGGGGTAFSGSVGPGGAGVYGTGGAGGYAPSTSSGGPGLQAYGGTGGTACNYSLQTGECTPSTTGGGEGGTGVLAYGGTGGPGGPSGIGVFAFAGAPGAGGTNFGLAGFFDGNVTITGTLSKGAGSFRIDHPQDPANKYLSHSFVESPDMMNIYNGNVVLDASGSAWIELPSWFGDLNRDFRYQLTAIGAPAPGLFIAEEIAENRFKVAGGAPGGKVSWTVTGIRQDAYANAHRIPVEEDKSPLEQGFYLHPDLYGQPAERNVIYAQHPELLRTPPTQPPAQPAPTASSGAQ